MPRLHSRNARLIIYLFATLAHPMHSACAIAEQLVLKQYEDPADLLKQIYDCEIAENCIRPDVDDLPKSSRLDGLWQKMRAREKTEEEGWILSCFDADPMTNAQDEWIGIYEIKIDLRATSQARLAVSMFSKYQEIQTDTVKFDFIREGGGWKIDDIVRNDNGGSTDSPSLRRNIEECLSAEPVPEISLHITADAAVFIPSANKTLSIFDDHFSVKALAEKFKGTDVSAELGGQLFITISIAGSDAALLSGDVGSQTITSIQFGDIYGFAVIDPYGTKLGDPLSEAVGHNALCYNDSNGSPYCVNPRRPHLRYSEADIDNSCPSLEAVSGNGKNTKIRDCSTVGIIEISRLEPGEN